MKHLLAFGGMVEFYGRRGDRKMLGLSPRCWCGGHWAGHMHPQDVVHHNRMVEEMIQKYNKPVLLRDRRGW